MRVGKSAVGWECAFDATFDALASTCDVMIAVVAATFDNELNILIVGSVPRRCWSVGVDHVLLMTDTMPSTVGMRLSDSIKNDYE